MIVWQGRGIIVAVITFGCLVATELFTRFTYHDNTYYQRHGWPKLAGFLIAAAIVWSISRRGEDDRTRDAAITREPLLRPRDTLFHIPIKYWPRVLCVLGVIFYFVRG
jgi:hypothetical protein